MRLKQENNLSKLAKLTALLNGSSRIQTQIQVVRARDRNKIVAKSENWPKQMSKMPVSTFEGF